MCMHGKITFMTVLKVKVKDSKGKVQEVICSPIYTDLEHPSVSKEEELSSILSAVGGQKVQVLNIDRDFRQLGGYI